MLIDEVYEAVKLLSAKDQSSGYLSPEDYNKYAELAQLDIITERYNSIKTLGYGSSNKLDEMFSEVKVVATLPVSGGIITKPADFLYYSIAHSYYVFNNEGRACPIRYLQDTEWLEANASEIERPTKDFPVIRALGNTFEVSPSTITQVNLSYIAVPTAPVWAYTSNGKVLSFDEGNSTDYTLSESEFNLLVFKIAKYFGIEITDKERYTMVENENVKDE